SVSTICELSTKTSKKTILVIDDDAETRETLHFSLTDAGYDAVCVADGQQGMVLADELLPDAILLNVQLSHQDGWSIGHQLKTTAPLAQIPLILLSAAEAQTGQLNVVASLPKPIDHIRLLDIIGTQLPENSGPKILVVEDDANARDIMGRSLQQHDWTVALAANGQQALDYLNNTIPSLIILDLMMPGMDGFEFVQTLRQTPNWCNIPVIVVTAKTLTAKDQQRLRGVFRIYPKADFNRQDLLDDVRSLAKINGTPVAG
ncbi:MAG: response regulator, partial [Symploca sp. SIO2G7]|nr:response regulator [Symploca sp. SIO2G7]